MGDLDPEPYRRKLGELYDLIKSNLPENIKEAYESALLEAQENGDDEEAIMQLERATLAAAIEEAEFMDDSDKLNQKKTEFRAKVSVPGCWCGDIGRIHGRFR